MDSATPSGRQTHAPDWLFWLSWVAASTAAILLGFGIMYALIFLAKAVLPGINEDRIFGSLMFPVLATVLDALQWVVLRRRIPRSGWWILVTGVGMLVGVALSGGVVQVISRVTGRPWNWNSQPDILVFYGIIGFALALAQLPILRRQFMGAALWLLASIVGWLILGLIIGKSIDRMSDIVALGAVPAAFTGLGLIWLTRTPRRQPARFA